MQTELVAVIMIEDERKSGGYAKLDLAQTLNRSPATTEEDLVLALTGCPDPEAFIELTLTYELINEGMTDEMRYQWVDSACLTPPLGTSICRSCSSATTRTRI